MKSVLSRIGIFCLFTLLLFSSPVLTAGTISLSGEGTTVSTSSKSWVSEYVANDAGCGARNILTLRAMVKGSGTIEVSGTAIPGRDFALLNPDYSNENNQENTQDFLLHIFDDAVLEGDETIILDFPGGLRHTITINDNESSVIVGNGYHLPANSWPFFRSSTPIATESVSVEAALGPLETVYFMSRDGNGVMGKITNFSNHDFGCVTVENMATDETSTYAAFRGCLPRIFSVTPTNPNSSARYQVTWYLTDEELSDYASTNVMEESEMRIFKEVGTKRVSPLTGSPAEVTWVAGGKALTATFKGSFGRFGVGFKTMQNSSYGFQEENFQGSQLRPVNPYLHKLRTPTNKTATESTASREVAGGNDE